MKEPEQTTGTARSGVPLKRLVGIFCERCPEGCRTRWWMGRAYADWARLELVMVIYPLHWVVVAACWANNVWSRHRMKPSWVDKELERRIANADISDGAKNQKP